MREYVLMVRWAAETLVLGGKQIALSHYVSSTYHLFHHYSPIDADEDGENGDQTDHSLVNNSTDQHLIQELLKEGPYVYELFSIMVHSGSANGGHYYAYIK